VCSPRSSPCRTAFDLLLVAPAGPCRTRPNFSSNSMTRVDHLHGDLPMHPDVSTSGPRPLLAHWRSWRPSALGHRRRRRTGGKVCVKSKTSAQTCWRSPSTRAAAASHRPPATATTPSAPGSSTGEPVDHPGRQRNRSALPQPRTRRALDHAVHPSARRRSRVLVPRPGTYRGHVGEKPMAITWELHTPLPGICISRSRQRWRESRH